jgi:hypothetical protein
MRATNVIEYLKSIQQPNTTTYVPAIFARRLASHRMSLAGNRVVFNQIRLFSIPSPMTSIDSPPIAVPAGLKVVASPVRPDTPSHFGKTYRSPFASDWKDALFQNYNKMLASGTFSAPLLHTEGPSNKTILCPCVACHVKDTSIRLHLC